MRVAIVGNFGLTYKATMAARALPLARALAERGHDVALFVPEDPRPAHPRSIGDTVRFTQIGPPLVGRRASRPRLVVDHLWLGWRLTLAALRFQPDVLYAFKPKAYAGLAMMLFWVLRRVGLVRSVIALDTDDWEGTGGWADREHASPITRWLVSWHERWCLRHADVVTVASRGLAKLAGDLRVSTLYLPNAAAPTSPGWPRADRQSARERLGIGRQPIVLAYTRFAEFAPERLLATFREILAASPDTRLVVAGQGLREEEKVFQALAARAGIAGSVHSLGWVPIDGLPDVFAASDVALYPLDDTLLNRTKCVMKLVDLLLAGVAVVADRVGQASEYIEDGQVGVLVPSGEVGAMARAATDLLGDPDRRKALGEAARATMLRRWTWQQQAATVESALAGHLSSKRSDAGLPKANRITTRPVDDE